MGDRSRNGTARRHVPGNPFPAAREKGAQLRWTPARERGPEDVPAPAESQCPHCGGLGFYRRDVPPGHPDFGEAFPCECTLRQRQAQHVSKLGKYSQLEALADKEFVTFLTDPPQYDERSCENLRTAYQHSLEFARHPQGWLFLQGRHGCGKTHLAAAIAHTLRQNGTPVLFKPVPDLLDLLRSSYNPDTEVSFDRIFCLVRDVAVLVLDDLGAQAATQWAQEKLYQLLNRRYVEQKPTVFTSNLAVWDFEERLQSRLSDARMVSRVVINAPDYRIQGGAAGPSQAAGPLSGMDRAFLHKDRSFRNFDVHRGSKADNPFFQNALNAAQQFAAEPRSWLVLNGPHGCGKTHLAAAIANAWRAQRRSVLFLEFTDLEDFVRQSMQSGYRSQAGPAPAFPVLFDALKNIPCLILDGYTYRTPRVEYTASERGSWVRRKVKNLLDHRYYARHPTVVTMCIPDEEIEEWLAARTETERAIKVTVNPFSAGPARWRRNPKSSY